MPPGTMAETSPGTVFLFAAICTDSNTFSTLDPSIPCKKQFPTSYVTKENERHYALLNELQPTKTNHLNLICYTMKSHKIYGKQETIIVLVHHIKKSISGVKLCSLKPMRFTTFLWKVVGPNQTFPSRYQRVRAIKDRIRSTLFFRFTKTK